MRGSGTFTFESDGKAGSKANLHDARLKMLELFGRDAVSWTIERVEKKKANTTISDGQMTASRSARDATSASEPLDPVLGFEALHELD